MPLLNFDPNSASVANFVFLINNNFVFKNNKTVYSSVTTK